jgi:anti-anti-sigma factor
MEQIKVENLNGNIILHLNGQFVGGEHTEDLKKTLKGLAEENHKNIILDFENVTYLNSSAIGVLIAAHASYIKKGGKLILCNVNQSIEHIFVITKLTLVFTMKDSVEEAIKSL